MERMPNEDFEDYKHRRSMANEAVKNINWRAKSGGSESARAALRSAARANKDNNFSVGIKGMASSVRSPMGQGIAASAAVMRATPARLAKHQEYLARAERRSIRAAGKSKDWLKAA